MSRKPEEQQKVSRHFPIEGVEIWRNPKNKFLVFQLHYVANPKKRGKQWRDETARAMPRAQYLQEYELNWESYAGLPVYLDWDQKRHGAMERIEPHVGLPLLRGWDFGLTPACVVAQLIGDQLCVLREYTAVNRGADWFSDHVLSQCALEFPEWGGRQWHDYIDPSGEFRKDTDEGTCAKILDSKGLRCIPGAISWEERRTSVEYYLTKTTKEGSCFKLNLGECPMLVRGFNGGYRYAEKSQEIEPHKIRPLKDEHSHAHDALQMITSRLKLTANKYLSKPVPVMSYGWSAVRGN